MRKQKYILWISLVFNAAFMLTLVINQVHKDNHSDRRSHRRGQTSEEWEKIPEDVKLQLRKIWSNFPKRIQPIQALLDSQRVQLSEILLQDKPDSTLINQRLESIGTLQTDLEKTIVHQMLREKNILPKEYQESFTRMMMWRIIRNRPSRRRDQKTNRDSTRTEQVGTSEGIER